MNKCINEWTGEGPELEKVMAKPGKGKLGLQQGILGAVTTGEAGEVSRVWNRVGLVCPSGAWILSYTQ